VLSACTIQPLVKHADRLVKLSRRVLGDGLTFGIVKHSFFAHFCAGKPRIGGGGGSRRGWWGALSAGQAVPLQPLSAGVAGAAGVPGALTWRG